MAQPVWITPAGNLGTIPEGVFFQFTVKAYDPDDPFNPDAVYYRMIAGQLPAGVSCTRTGLIEGIPQAVSSLQGVPTEVSRDVTSKFSVRVYTEIDEVITNVNDRTFTLTVTGEDVPVFITPSGNIGHYLDGDVVSFQIQSNDTDPPDLIVYSIAAGSLPPGLSLTTTGLITGYIDIIQDITDYNFTVEISDGKLSNLREFSMEVTPRSMLSADDIDITSDTTYITADAVTAHSPIILNTSPSNLGTYRSDNWFAYQFTAIDLDGSAIVFLDVPGTGYSLPTGTTLDPTTGWLYGYIPNLGVTDIEFQFRIIAAKESDPTIHSAEATFTMNVIGQIDVDVVWLSPADLGSIENGSLSLFEINAVSIGGKILEYYLEPGSYPTPNTGVYNKLPQGLALLPSGDISGRVSFNTFALDSGTTTFDKLLSTRLTAEETTFDMVRTFTVNARSGDGLVSALKTFSITVVRTYNEPYDNLYIKAMPPQEDRDLLAQLLLNQDIFVPSLIYRPQDPYFGVPRSVVYYHAFGLTSDTLEKYVSGLYINHYWKNLVLGEIKVAQALDADDNVLYEVVYSQIIDDQVNTAGESVSKEITLPYPAVLDDSSAISVAYPNSLINMRNQVIDTVGQISKTLPLWMTSKQTNGQVLGFVPAWVIAYCKPGKGGQVAYNIRDQFGEHLNLVDFKVDRYELDRLLSIHWSPTLQHWEPTPAATTFDLVNHYRITGITGGSGYNIGDIILIVGSDLGGEDDINDVILTVQEINTVTGAVTLAHNIGEAPLFSTGLTYTNISGTNLIGTGSGADFDFVVTANTPTLFDGNSLRFEAPVDVYTTTDAYDKYLLFPRHNILE